MRRSVVPVGSLCLVAFAVLGAPRIGLSGSPTRESVPPPRVFALDAVALQQGRQCLIAGDALATAALQRLVERAEKDLAAGPFSVVDNPHVAPSGDPHDYHSLAIYWWPNPFTGRPYIYRDGQRNPEYREFDLPRLDQMATTTHRLARAYYYTREPRYAEHTATLLRAWFLDADTRMNPNLDYAQAIPGLVSGTFAGIIEAMNLTTQTIDAIGLIQDSVAWSEQDQQGMEAWFREYLDWLQTSMPGHLERAQPNNHGTWYDVQVVTLALFLDDRERAREVLRRWSLRRVCEQFDSEGRQPRELSRSRSWDYSIYNLRAWLDLATLARHVDVDLWSHTCPEGQSIRLGFEYLLQYAEPNRKWPHDQIGSITPQRSLASLLHRVQVGFDPDRVWLNDVASGIELSGQGDPLLHSGPN